MNPGDWAWCEDLRGFCRVIETQDLWGETLCRVWSPAQDAVVRVRAAQLQPLAEAQLSSSPSYLTYLTDTPSSIFCKSDGRALFGVG